MTFDLDAYCRRIGFSGEWAPTLTTLREVHRRQPQAITFENLGPLLGEPVPLEVAALERKLVQGRRGGYCYEQNRLFGAALETFGFKIRNLHARVYWNTPEGVILPRTHLLLLVEVAGERYIADVGFGPNTLTGPLRLDSRAEQDTPHGPFRIVAAGDLLVLQACIRGAWEDLYGFDLQEQALPDLEVGNWFTSTHPQSRFRSELMVARVDPGGRWALRNGELAYHPLGGPTERRSLGSAGELRRVLTGTFGLSLPVAPELNALLARAASAPRKVPAGVS